MNIGVGDILGVDVDGRERGCGSACERGREWKDRCILTRT